MLAGVSVDYYTKLERGAVGIVSEAVLDAVSRALQLTPTERDHLFHLTGTATSLRTSATPPRQYVRPSVQRILDGLADSPAFVGTATRHLIAANALGRATYAPLYETAADGVPNTARYMFLDPGARTFFPEWHDAASSLVANLRREVGSDPLSRELHGLVDDLNRESEDFRRFWQSHDVRTHDTGLKLVHHPLVGKLSLTFETMDLPSDPGQRLIVYGAEPGSETADRLRLLASWSLSERAANEGSAGAP